jgi:hypothetical protein
MIKTNDTRQAAAHTPEPWRIHRLNNGWPVITSDAHDIADLRLNGNGLSYLEANARRIVAAVNACKGLATEALERGVIAELRHILSELLTASGDLDAALDGVTDQFDAERAKLNAAIRTAQAVLDGSTGIDLHELLASRSQIALGWAVEDVQEIRPDLTGEQAWEVLQDAQHKHDASIGINWDTLELIAEDLFGPTPETNAQEDERSSMSRYIGYEVRAFAQRGERNGTPVYKRVSDDQAELFSIYGHVGIFQWEWIEDVPTREYGERRIQYYRESNLP